MLSLVIVGTQNAVFMVPPILVEISSGLDVSVAVAGQLATATFAAWAVSLITAGPLSDSFGRRPVILGGLLMLVASVTASAFAPNILLFLLFRVMTGLAAGMLPPTAVGVLSDVISLERRAQAVSSLLAIGILTSAVSVPLALGLADLGGWRFAFLVSGFLLAAGLLACWFWFPRDSREKARNWAFFSRYWSLVSLPFFQVAVAVGLSQRIAFWTMVSYFAAYLRDAYELSAGFAALPLGIVAVGQAVGSFFGGPAATKQYRAVLIGATSAAGGVCAFLCFTMGFPALGGGGRGHGSRWPAGNDNARAGRGKHRILGRLQVHRGQHPGTQQPGRGRGRRRRRRGSAGQRRLRGTGILVPGGYNLQRVDSPAIRQAPAYRQRLT